MESRGFGEERRFANKVLPGLTGLAQIFGRDGLEMSVKAKYDGSMWLLFVEVLWQEQYYRVNTDLAIETAARAKACGETDQTLSKLGQDC